MTIEYLLVTYPDQRSVLADGAAVGITNHTLLLPSDEYIITLDGTGYQPASQDIVLSGTSLVRPMVVPFTPATTASAKVAAVATPRATPPARRRKPKHA